MPEIELEPNQKHEYQESYLTQGIQVTKAVGWENGGGYVWREPTQQGRSEQDSREHLAHDPWLVKLAEQPACEPRGHQDGPDL
jgi:hypothetical protein